MTLELNECITPTAFLIISSWLQIDSASSVSETACRRSCFLCKLVSLQFFLLPAALSCCIFLVQIVLSCDVLCQMILHLWVPVLGLFDLCMCLCQLCCVQTFPKEMMLRCKRLFLWLRSNFLHMFSKIKNKVQKWVQEISSSVTDQYSDVLTRETVLLGKEETNE